MGRSTNGTKAVVCCVKRGRAMSDNYLDRLAEETFGDDFGRRRVVVS